MHLGKAVILLSSVLCVSSAKKNPNTCKKGNGDNEIVTGVSWILSIMIPTTTQRLSPFHSNLLLVLFQQIRIQCKAGDGSNCLDANGKVFAEIDAEDCKEKMPITLTFKVSNPNEFDIKMKKKSSKFTFNGDILDLLDITNVGNRIKPGQSKKMEWKGYYNSCIGAVNDIEAFVRVTTPKEKGKSKRQGACKCINSFLSHLLFICDMNVSLGHFVSSLFASL